MYNKKYFVVTSIFAAIVIMLFIFPSTDNLTNAGQSKSIDVTALTNVHRISVSSDEVLVHYFGKDIVEKTMRQPGCVGVRMYYGKHANGKSGFIFVGFDKYGKDLAPTVITGPTSICPPECHD
jgi:hypothetical protein